MLAVFTRCAFTQCAHCIGITATYQHRLNSPEAQDHDESRCNLSAVHNDGPDSCRCSCR
jgi:hypothetical protein